MELSTLLSGLAGGFGGVLVPDMALYLVLGVSLGITVGAIPGLTGSMLIALSLPATFFMRPEQAMVLLVAEYVGSVSGGLISATLLRMPGTPASVMTTLDGYPLARQGKPGRALGLGVLASLVGGLVSCLFLFALSKPLAEMAVHFGPWELFSLTLLALMLIASVGEGSLIRALLSGLLGVMIALPGIDPSVGMPRLTFGSPTLEGGFALLPVLVGIYAVSQIFRSMATLATPVERTGPVAAVTIRWHDLRRHGGNLFRSSVIGTLVGILPGVGANIGSVLAYLAAKTTSKTPAAFGTGAEEGIIAAEAGNNATVGGALIPLIALGIPGSIADVFLIGALVIHGITPGPLLFTTNSDLVYIIMAACLLANIVMFACMLMLIRYLRRLADIPIHLLAPVILVFCVVGAFALNNQLFDVWVMLGCGVLGFIMERARIPLAPFVIGFVLAPIAEAKLRMALMISDGSVWPVLDRPLAVLLLGLSLMLLCKPLFQPVWRRALKS